MAVEVLTREGHTERDLRFRGLVAGEQGKGYARIEPDSTREKWDPRAWRRFLASGAVVVVRPRSK